MFRYNLVSKLEGIDAIVEKLEGMNGYDLGYERMGDSLMAGKVQEGGELYDLFFRKLLRNHMKG